MVTNKNTQLSNLFESVERNALLSSIAKGTYAAGIVTSAGVFSNYTLRTNRPQVFAVVIVLIGVVAYVISSRPIFASPSFRLLAIIGAVVGFVGLLFTTSADAFFTIMMLLVTCFSINQSGVREDISNLLAQQTAGVKEGIK